jgi:hypothetical protein
MQQMENRSNSSSEFSISGEVRLVTALNPKPVMHPCYCRKLSCALDAL